jgi:hypothetical protein
MGRIKANSDIEDRSDKSDCLPPSFSSNVTMSNGHIIAINFKRRISPRVGLPL